MATYSGRTEQPWKHPPAAGRQNVERHKAVEIKRKTLTSSHRNCNLPTACCKLASKQWVSRRAAKSQPISERFTLCQVALRSLPMMFRPELLILMSNLTVSFIFN